MYDWATLLALILKKKTVLAASAPLAKRRETLNWTDKDGRI